MANLLASRSVVQHLLDAMQQQVTSYHPDVQRTATSVDELIDGTAFFPGGCGLWRGVSPHGKMPETFPSSPVLFVGHNFDSIRAYQKAKENGGEAGGQFWQRLIHILRAAGLQPADCFFTNALMGLRPGSATGPMPRAPLYIAQCSQYLQTQIEIVRPRAIVALGDNAEKYIAKLGVPWMKSLHPSHWDFRELVTREERLKVQGRAIASFLAKQK